MKIKDIEKISKLLRYYIILSTTEAGSGHPTSSLSAVELMSVLLFGGFFKYKIDNTGYEQNDRIIFSKGHAAPLMYAMWAAAGAIEEAELLKLRKFGSRLEGHPTPAFPYAEAATGSLGHGLSIGAGMALNAKYIDMLPCNTFVLLGDSEMTEGSQWEAIQIAAHYRLDNLIGIIDVNRLGQRGSTIYGHDTEKYSSIIKSFGWETFEINGHDLNEIKNAYSQALKIKNKPAMIIAKTIKGKGISFIEDMQGWHGKTLSRDQMDAALKELGEIDKTIRGKVKEPGESTGIKIKKTGFPVPDKNMIGELGALTGKISTRMAYGISLAAIFEDFPEIVVLDAEVSNSTFSEIFKKVIPQRFFEMYVAEQNMAGFALGLSLRNKIVFASSFAAFLTRAFDQVRMSRYSNANIKFCGSHAGVSIGQDGVSQMGLEDIAMFRTSLDCVVLYPCDGISTFKLVQEAARHSGMVYIRTTRAETEPVYKADEDFVIGGSKVLRRSDNDRATVVAAGITLHEALAAYEILKARGINIRVIDLYCIKPLDKKTINKAAEETGHLITVEDHFAEGGIGEAVLSSLDTICKTKMLAVRKIPKSAKPGQLLDYEEISRNAIVENIKSMIASDKC
ncbi:MAG: transketolase [Actinobacteria bacterium]|nr:transketolase [Actinomycetota bacterium]